MPHFFENRQEYRSVYILLTRSDTYFSRLIHLLTDEDYTHVSICLDADLQHFYSFGRKSDIFMFPAGFVQETLQDGVFRRFHQMPCALYELQVPLNVYRANSTAHPADAIHRRHLSLQLSGRSALQAGICPSTAPSLFLLPVCSRFIAKKRCIGIYQSSLTGAARRLSLPAPIAIALSGAAQSITFSRIKRVGFAVYCAAKPTLFL